MDIGHVAPELTLAVGGIVCVLAASFAPSSRQWITSVLGVGASAVAGGFAVALAVGTRPQLGFEGSWSVDGVTHGAELIVCAATAVTLLASVEWFATDPRRGELPGVVLFAATGALLLAGAADTMEIVIGMLLTSVTGYTLTAYHRGSPAGMEAAMKYFLVGALTNAVLLVGVVLLFAVTGTTRLAEMADRLEAADAIGPALIAVVVCLILGLGFEIGSVPAHVWLPDVAQAAPAPLAGFLTVVPKVGATVALARVGGVLPDDAVAWRPLVAVVAAVTMTLGNLGALWQDDLRRLLGWSSVSQAGYALMAVTVVGTGRLAPAALVVFLAGYAAANLAAFAVVTELRGRTRLDGYDGLAADHPWLAAALAVSLLSLVGIPPLGGFVGKLTLFTAVIDGGYSWLAAVAVANTVISLLYYLRVIGPMYLGERGAAAAPAAVLGQTAAVAVGIATLAVVALGIGAGPLLDALSASRLLP